MVARAEERGFVAVRARGSELEASIAFGVARQLFEPPLRSATAARRRGLLSGVAEVGARALGFGGADAPADRFGAFHGLYWLCANLAQRQPVIVAVDDVQWVDDPSLAWLGYLGRRCGELPVLVAATLREGEVSRDQVELVGLVGAAAIERVGLAPLSPVSVGVLVRTDLDARADAEFCAVCHRLTGGNPFYLRELLTAARTEGLRASANDLAVLQSIVPVAIGTSVLARLTRMGQPAIALARALAVLGGGTEVATAAELAGLDLEAAELAADALAAVQILAPVRPLEFFHPLIAAALYRDLAPGERRLAHRRAAVLVDRDGAVGRVAAHLLATGPAGDEWVVSRLIAAAGEAAERGAPEAAVSYLRRALAEPPSVESRPQLLLALGEAEWRSGALGAVEHLTEARAQAVDRATSIAAARELAFAYVITDQAPLAVQMLEAALREEGDGQSEPALMLEGAIAAVGQWDERTASAAGARAEALLHRIEDLPGLPVGVAAALAFHAAKSNRPAGQAERLVERALASTPYPPQQDFANALVTTLWLTESYGRALQLCDAELVSARRRGDVHDLVEISVYRSWVLLRHGELADAEAHARWALDRAEGSARMGAIASLIEILVERDAIDAAEAALRADEDLFSSRFIVAVQCVYARARLRTAQGRREEALVDLYECRERCRRLELRCVSGTPWRSEAALVHHLLGQSEQAQSLAREELELARAFGRPRAIAVALRANALIDGRAQGIAILREAIRLLSGSPARLELARALTDYGAALRRCGQRTEARAQLGRGLDLAHSSGARAIARRARAELIAAGAKPRRDAITGRDALTASELRVARLAAQGMTNREIAQALYISSKTTSVHLSRVYRKLEIHSRRQLADALAAPANDKLNALDATGDAIS